MGIQQQFGGSHMAPAPYAVSSDAPAFQARQPVAPAPFGTVVDERHDGDYYHDNQALSPQGYAPQAPYGVPNHKQYTPEQMPRHDMCQQQVPPGSQGYNGYHNHSGNSSQRNFEIAQSEKSAAKNRNLQGNNIFG